ncbi:MAG TPA: leucyl aminopeptidase family protein [Micromonosporaceae bacterium]|nr:leucyl aminopeptidase family protein [Micromonosporaceae bacterium]
MLTVRLAARPGPPQVLALPVTAGELLPTSVGLVDAVAAQASALLAEARDRGSRPAGAVTILPRPEATPRRLLLVEAGQAADLAEAGQGAGEAGWRAAGAGVVRAAQRDPSVTFAVPPGTDPAAVRALAEGAWLAAYRFRLGREPAGGGPALRRLTLAVADPAGYEDALAEAQVVARATALARDLTNMPSQTKTPAWLAAQVVKAAGQLPGLRVTVREPAELAAAGFGGILAVGGGSRRGPRLVEVAWRPRGARLHVVLVGKGITFDTGGISIKPRDAMKLMRKDMAGAAAVTAAAIGAAELRLPVRVTALAPLAENMVSGSAYRPGDVVHHYGGLTTEVRSTDAEGRVVLGDALAYAVARLRPDVLVDLATLTGAGTVALGKRTAAVYGERDDLVAALVAAGAETGEQLWRMPLVEDYVPALAGDDADLNNAANIGAGSVTAALYLREFAGAARDRWAHLDMSAPAWSDSVDGELPKGATGFGVRTLLRWLSTLDGSVADRQPPG